MFHRSKNNIFLSYLLPINRLLNRDILTLFLSKSLVTVILTEPFDAINDHDGFYLLRSKLASLDQNSSIIGLDSPAHYGDNLIHSLINYDFKMFILMPIIISAICQNNIRKRTYKISMFVIAITPIIQNPIQSLSLH